MNIAQIFLREVKLLAAASVILVDAKTAERATASLSIQFPIEPKRVEIAFF